MKRTKIAIALIITLWLFFVAAAVMLILQVNTNSNGIEGPAGPTGPAGPAGSVGPQGPQGNQGAQGSQGAPGTPGQDGAPGQDGTPGQDGAPGKDGNTWHYGTTEPAPELGNDGDFYFYKIPGRVDGYIIYYKEDGVWKIVVQSPAPVSVGTKDDFVAALNSGANAVLSANVGLSERYAMKSGQSTIIDGNGNILSMPNGVGDNSNTTLNRIINIQDVNDVYLALKNITYDASNCERGISLYGANNVTVDVKNAELIALKYALNVASLNTDVIINVVDSAIQGYCAIQSYSSDTVFNVENSTLIGLNQWYWASDTFATIVINPAATDNKITIKNTRIEATEMHTEPQYAAVQYFASIRATGAELVFENCTFVKNGVELTDIEEIAHWFNAYEEVADSFKLTINGTVIGKNMIQIIY